MTVHQLVRRPTVQGALALDLGARRPLGPPPPRPLALVGTAGGTADVVPLEPRVRGELDAWVHRYAQAAVEIIGGDRPAHQLVRWSSEDVLTDLQRRALLIARAGGQRHGSPAARRTHQVRPHVVSVHSSVVTPSVAEATARVRYGARSRAVALRFERRRDHWLCVALELG